MDAFLKTLQTLPEVAELVSRVENGGCPAVLTGTQPVQRACVGAAVAAGAGRPMVFLCADEREARQLAGDLQSLTGETPVTLLAREWQFRPNAVSSREWERSRLAALHQMAAGNAPVVVATVDALLARTMPAGIFVLEELEHAKARGAHIYAEIGGYGATCDAHHVTTPLEDGSAAARAMTLAMQDAGVAPEEVDYINAHGTSTKYNDLFETRAIKLAFGDSAYKVHINSTKSMIGHMFAGGGAVELITCVKSINEGYIHPTVGLLEDDPECDLDYTKGEGIHTPVHIAISNSLGFGGHNATVLVKEYQD